MLPDWPVYWLSQPMPAVGGGSLGALAGLGARDRVLRGAYDGNVRLRMESGDN